MTDPLNETSQSKHSSEVPIFTASQYVISYCANSYSYMLLRLNALRSGCVWDNVQPCYSCYFCSVHTVCDAVCKCKQDSNYPHLTNCAAHCTVYLNMFELPFSVRIVCHNILYLLILFNISFLNRFLTGLPKVNMKLQSQPILRL